MLIVRLTLCAVRLGLFFSLLLFKLHASMMHHSTCQLVDADFLISSEAQNVNGSLFLYDQMNHTLFFSESKRRVFYIVCHSVYCSVFWMFVCSDKFNKI